MSPWVRLEVGVARTTPALLRPISSWVHDETDARAVWAGLVDNRPPPVHCVHPVVTLLEKIDAISRRWTRGGLPARSFVRHYEDAARIVEALPTLPQLPGGIDVLLAEMLEERRLRVRPWADDPAFVLAPGERTDEVRVAWEDLRPFDLGRAGAPRRGGAASASLDPRQHRAARLNVPESPPRGDRARYKQRLEGRMPTYFDIEVSLSTAYPLIWRRFLLRATGTTFADLHRAIQDACGWWDYHLYRFDEATPRGLVGVAQSPVEIEETDDDTPPADEVPLARWVGKFAPRACQYLYDFGDDWHHDVVVRDIVDSDERFFRRLVGGERSFPKEDCGSMPGFERILEFRRTGVDPYNEGDLGLWLGDWQPDVDIERVRAQFDSDRKPRARR